MFFGLSHDEKAKMEEMNCEEMKTYWKKWIMVPVEKIGNNLTKQKINTKMKNK